MAPSVCSVFGTAVGCRLINSVNIISIIYAVQQDIQSFLMIEFIHHMLPRHVSDLTGPSSGAFYKLYVQIWYVVIRILLDTSSRYFVTAGRVE